MQQNNHARISASRVERIMLCPASFSLEAMMPESESGPAAQRGTDIHAIAEAMLLGKEWGPADEDLVGPAKEYVKFINAFNLPVHVESNLTPALSTLHPHLGGTADAIMINNDQLVVVDLKTGRIPVSAKNNRQLMTYALGAYMLHGNEDIKTVQMLIFQPEIGLDQSILTIEELKRFEHQLLRAVEAANDPFAIANPSNKACKYCRAKPVCPSIRTVVTEKAKQEFNDNNLESLLDAATLAGDWADSVKEYAKKKIQGGDSAGKWQLKNGRKMVSWANKVGAEAYFAGNEQAFEIKSPAALKKMGIEIPADYLEEKVSAPSLFCKELDL